MHQFDHPGRKAVGVVQGDKFGQSTFPPMLGQLIGNDLRNIVALDQVATQFLGDTLEQSATNRQRQDRSLHERGQDFSPIREPLQRQVHGRLGDVCRFVVDQCSDDLGIADLNQDLADDLGHTLTAGDRDLLGLVAGAHDLRQIVVTEHFGEA